MPVNYSKIVEKPTASPNYAAIAESTQTPNPQPPAQWNGAEIHAREGGPGAWLDDLDADLRQGGGRTFIGRYLGIAQGRGEKGYSGMESGTTKGTADFVESVPLGAVKAAQGLAETHDHPVKGALRTLSGIMQMATIPTLLAGGPIAEAATAKIPSAEWAGQLFESIAKDAGEIPVNLSRTGDEILRVKELADAGTSMPQAIGKMLNRVTKPGSKPLTYSEARDFYSNITRLSADEMGRLNPIMKRQVGAVASALKEDIGDAAGEVGRAGDYYAAMKDYARASQLKRVATQLAKEIGIPLAKIGIAGAAAKAGWDLIGPETRKLHDLAGR